MENENRVYLKYLVDKNVGPLTDVRIDFPFSSEGNPKPVILVGENGTGKSTILSNIVDAFFEMAGKIYSNACQSNDGIMPLFFKSISPAEIHKGTSFMYSVISFTSKINLYYVFKSGVLSFSDFKDQISNDILIQSWGDHFKEILPLNPVKELSAIWGNNVICYFGPDRYEKPFWMGKKYYQTVEFLHPTVKENFNGILKNQIIVQDVTSLNLQWILDVITDSRSEVSGDLYNTNNNISFMKLDRTNLQDLFLLKQSRNNLETILSKIIGEEVCFRLNFRNSGGARFSIIKKNDGSIVCPTLDSLSTGQIALFNLFATIVRYADNNNIDQSIHLEKITGIVVIDEIELHLHSKLQKEVLPQLIKLFPKVQFVITSHSPLFLLGMRDTFGEDGFEVYAMPDGRKIDVECFSEFLRAYDYIKETKQFQEEIKDLAQSMPEGNKPLIITEGFTDWIHMKTAYQALSSKDEHKELFDELDIEFLEFYPKNSDVDTSLKYDMGNNALIPLCETLTKLPNHRKYIIIADHDTPNITSKLSDNNKQYRNWGNNTFSLVLPIPEIRKGTPRICIEHYYSDEEIEKEIEINGIKRHLFMGKDFDEHGHNFNMLLFCERKDLCGPDKINIIDGTNGEKVHKLSSDDKDTNYAISKSEFANYVQFHRDEFDFSNFIQLFRLIKSIVSEESENA